MREDEPRRGLGGRAARIAIPTVAAVGAGSAIAVAATGGDTIDACYRAKGSAKGTLRIADECRKG